VEVGEKGEKELPEPDVCDQEVERGEGGGEKPAEIPKYLKKKKKKDFGARKGGGEKEPARP